MMTLEQIFMASNDLIQKYTECGKMTPEVYKSIMEAQNAAIKVLIENKEK